jgi:short-subunit dehydrogenase
MIALSHLTHVFLQDMTQRKQGMILNVSSVAAFVPGPLMASYYASKAFVLSFSLALASELKDTGVSCTVLCPGPTQTGFMKNQGQDTWLAKRNLLATAESVAKLGFEGMLKQKMLVVPGLINNFVVRLSSLVPPTWGSTLLHFLQKRNRA